MKNNFNYLEYDSELFGYKVANIINIHSKKELHSTLSALRNEKYRLCYFSTDITNESHFQWVNEENGQLADTKVTFSKRIAPENISEVKEIEIYNSRELTTEIISLAFQSGIYSRFKTDKHFKNNEFESLYLDWIKKSVSGEIADYVLVFRVNEKIVGMVTLKLSDTIATIGLIAVDSQTRGLGVGRKLLKKVEYIAFINNCFEIHVSTQEANKSAMNFYLKNNYSISLRKNIFHFWL